jgi:hypothetical protein
VEWQLFLMVVQLAKLRENIYVDRLQPHDHHNTTSRIHSYFLEHTVVRMLKD